MSLPTDAPSSMPSAVSLKLVDTIARASNIPPAYRSLLMGHLSGQITAVQADLQLSSLMSNGRACHRIYDLDEFNMTSTVTNTQTASAQSQVQVQAQAQSRGRSRSRTPVPVGPVSMDAHSHFNSSSSSSSISVCHANSVCTH